MLDAIAELGAAVGVDAYPHLSVRALSAGWTRRATVSCGGAAHLLAAGTEWVALSLPRAVDVEALPAFLETTEQLGVTLDERLWARVAAHVAPRDASTIVERARMLGLAAARLGERRPTGSGVIRTVVGSGLPSVSPPLVVDLSSLWAGPLCSRVLADMLGARVVKIEASDRPDGARAGPIVFYDQLHHGHESVALDFSKRADLAALRRLVGRADVVVEGSRPRALEQLGIRAADLLADGPRVWVSITGHGRAEPRAGWIGFGDDAAVAGGLVARVLGAPPMFAVDAIADPLAGLAAAGATRDALRSGERVLLDVGLSAVAAAVAARGGDALWTPVATSRSSAPAPPQATPSRRTRPARPALGRDTAAVLRELGG
ncbi:MAG TPA: CoA transferase [Acidimicrobiia bacterium]|nr:CoA transferase [Acidimicrobiia bacterium]